MYVYTIYWNLFNFTISNDIEYEGFIVPPDQGCIRNVVENQRDKILSAYQWV